MITSSLVCISSLLCLVSPILQSVHVRCSLVGGQPTGYMCVHMLCGVHTMLTLCSAQLAQQCAGCVLKCISHSASLVVIQPGPAGTVVLLQLAAGVS
jgi:hypothetical protein